MRIVTSEYTATGFWDGVWDETGVRKWAEDLRTCLRGVKPTLGLVFLSPAFQPHASTLLELLRVHAQVPLLLGCSASSLIQGGEENEGREGIVLGLYHLPGAELKATHISPFQIEESESVEYWHRETGVEPAKCHGWLAFADPFRTDCETWLKWWNKAYSPQPILGGLASGQGAQEETQLYLNGEVFNEGVVAVSVGGSVAIRGVVSQGCTPIGQTWTVTKAQGNVIQEIGNRPAYQVLAQTFKELPVEIQKRAQGNLFIGLVVNEYQEDFRRGDFLVRNLMAGDPVSGVLAVGARPRPGQSLQFQCRDAAAATQDMTELLLREQGELKGHAVYGACLCTCAGRGKNLFGSSDHDASLVQQHFGPFGLTGFFCNGEIGPVGGKSYLHGYTACLTLFVHA